MKLTSSSTATTFYIALGCLVFRPSTSPGETVWVEGEDATTRRVTAHSWYDGVKTDVLSGGRWLSHFDGGREGRAEYAFDVRNGGRYTFWLRANHVKSELSYRLDDGDWRSVDFRHGLRGAINIAKDNKPDLRFIAWVKVGRFELKPGRHTLVLRLHSANSNHGAVDCFAWTNDGFVPSGTRRPSAGKVKAGPSDWFAVVPDDDPFAAASLTDVSHLVEAPAGKFGFLRADSKDLRFEKKRGPVKFWGMGSNLGRRETDDEMEQAARWYRKNGINLVRQHTVIADVGLLGPKGFDARRLDRYDRWFATLKRHGIYTCWSVVYPHHGAFVRSSDPLDPETFRELDRVDRQRDGRRRPIVAGDFINLDRELQDLALRYFRALLEHRNPHTGLRYKDDPALAIVEFQNESNVFFHTLNGLRSGEFPRYAKRLRQAFYRFAKAKYGSEAAVRKAWGRPDRDDRWQLGELGLLAPYHWGAEGPLHEFKGQPRRCGDYLEFLAGLQRSYYERRERELREIGFRGVTVTTGWKGVGASSLPNLWCDTAAGLIDRHNYFGGGAGRHRIVEGAVNQETHLGRPGRGLLNLGLFQVENKPFGVSEWTQMPPNPWKLEAAPLVAFYGIGLQGWDVSCHFACSEARLGDGWPGLSKYATHTPHYMGQFPALAFAIHQGHIREGDAVAARSVTRGEVFSGTDFLGQSIAQGGHDTKRLSGNVSTSPELLAIGRVTVAFTGDGKKPETKDAETFWDRDARILESTTGQLRWNYGERFVEVRSRKTQGVVGFAGGRSVRLPAVRVDVTTRFCSLILTPLDNRDLEDSNSILITAMARDKLTGSRYSEDGARLERIGGPPLLMEPVQAVLRFDGRRPARVRPLDIYGVPQGGTVAVERDGSVRIDGRYRALYYHISR